MKIDPADPRLTWPGAISFERTDTYLRPWRIPYDQRALFAPELLPVASTQSGIRLTFKSSTTRISGRILPTAENQPLDLFVDGQFVESFDMNGKTEFAFSGLPASEKLIELWLPQRGDFALEFLEIDDGASLTKHQDNRPKWVTYGSSITHCKTAASPSQTWPAIVARERNLNLTSLGFGGQCHLDIMIARLIRDLPADYISICCGINIMGGSTLNARTFGPTILGFVQLIREKHPTTPILLISPIYSCHRESTPNAVGWTLQDYRNAVADAARVLQDQGDRNIHYLNGLELFGKDLEHLLPDQLHPNAEGYQIMGRNFLKLTNSFFG